MTTLTGKTISQLNTLETITPNSLFIVEYSGVTYNIPYSGITTQYSEISYSSLVDKITGSTLNTGSYYLITDFKTCYDQPDYDYNKNAITSGIYRDDTEIQPILVFATSTNTISEIAYQPAYPKDTIKYDWAFDKTERTNGVAYGRISERIDEFNNRTDYDHRQIKFKRYRYYEIALGEPYQGTVEVINISGTVMTVSGTGTNFLSSVSVGNKIGFEPNTEFSNNDYRVYEVISVDSDSWMIITGLTTVNFPNTTMYSASWAEYSSYYQNNVDDPSVFEEYYTFDFSDNYNNYIGNHTNLYNWEENDFILANNVFYTRFKNNKFGDSCYNNTFFDDCENNNIGNFFYNNITDDDFDGNVIGNGFCNNKITSNFQYNRIGESFRDNYIVQNDFYRNNIMNGFEYNEISGGDFQNNEIGSGFNNNILRNGQFYKNDIGNGYNGNKIYYSFYGNLIGNAFNYNDIYCEFSDNTIGEYFGDNYLGDVNDVYSYVFNENVVGVNFLNNTIFSDFYKNHIGVGFEQNNISGFTTNNFIGNQFSNNTIYNNFTNNKISNDFKGNMMFQSFDGNNIDSFIGGNHFSGGTYDNNIGSYTFDNDFLGNVSNNSWKVSFYGNTIGAGFQDNNIGSNFYSNIIGDNFGYGYSLTQGNRIGNNFFNNTIGEYFYNNSIPDNFNDNQVGDYFQWNVINTIVNYTDFTTNYGNITAFTYTTLGTPGKMTTDGIYTNLNGTTSGHGVDAFFDIEVLGNTVIGVSGNTLGKLYNINDTITILGSQIGGITGNIISGTPANKLSVKVYKPADATYTYPNDETEMDYLIDNSPLFDTYYSSNIQGVSYSTKTGTDQDNYAIVIEGYIEIPSNNTYYFGLSSDDGSDAFINGVKVADWYGAHGDSGNAPSGNQYPIILTAGTHSIKVRMQERSGGDIVTLLYSLDGISWNIIPNNWFPLNVTGTTGTYSNINAQGGDGTNAAFDVIVVDGLVDSVTLSNGGGSYSVGNVLTIPGSAFGGTEDITITIDSIYSDDVIITVTGTNPNPSVYETYTCQIFERQGGDKRLSYYDSASILTIKNINE